MYSISKKNVYALEIFSRYSSDMVLLSVNNILTFLFRDVRFVIESFYLCSLGRFLATFLSSKLYTFSQKKFLLLYNHVLLIINYLNLL